MSRARAIGIDIGGTRLRVALVDDAGQVLVRAETRTLASAAPQAVVEQVAELVRHIVPEHAALGLSGAGTSRPEPLDTERGVALGVPTLKDRVEVSIVAMIASRLGMRARPENDGVAAAHGEWRFGAARGLQHMVYVTVSTGIGGGAVIDGHLLHGRGGMAGHVGHMSIERDGLLCACGNRGYWEAYASGAAFARRIGARGGRWLGAEARLVFDATQNGDAEALDLTTEEADLLGVGIANGFALMESGIRRRIALNAMPAFARCLLSWRGWAKMPDSSARPRCCSRPTISRADLTGHPAANCG
ncbi:MAG: ROK family protein [Candidatus Devosia euplotis]|nr:ROK family protein [Candidatus Devosia euplotis]